MAAIVDDYLDSPMDNDDVFPCKGCGEVRLNPRADAHDFQLAHTVLTASDSSRSSKKEKHLSLVCS